MIHSKIKSAAGCQHVKPYINIPLLIKIDQIYSWIIMQHWVIFYLRAKKHHKISTKDLQKVFSSQA